MTREEPTPHSILWDLARKVVGHVENCRVTGEMVKTRRRVIHTELRDYVYNYAAHCVTFDALASLAEEEELSLAGPAASMEMTLPYKCFVNAYGVTPTHFAGLIDRFVSTLTEKAKVFITEQQIGEHVATFLRDLDSLQHGNLEWQGKVWLEGVWLENNRCELPRGVVLRRPTPEDLRVKYQTSMDAVMSQFILDTTAVLEFPFRGTYVMAMNEKESLLAMLRLFRLGSVRSIQSVFVPSSVLYAPLWMGNDMSHSHYHYSVAAADEADLARFFQQLRQVIPPWVCKRGEVHPYKVALNRLNEGLVTSSSASEAQRTTFAITCLESLYLRAPERGELQHRLAQRAAAVLRHYAQQPRMVYDKVREGYGIRSEFIHGGLVPYNAPDDMSVRKRMHDDSGGDGGFFAVLQSVLKLPPSKAETLCRQLFEFARMSLLAFLQVRGRVEKDEFIAKLDNSLLDEGAAAKVHQLLTEGVLMTTPSPHEIDRGIRRGRSVPLYDLGQQDDGP